MATANANMKAFGMKDANQNVSQFKSNNRTNGPRNSLNRAEDNLSGQSSLTRKIHQK